MIQYYIGIFIAGFSLMTVEIVSSRIVAPIIGSSIFTWTAVIGTILLGLSVGNLVGGWIADKYLKIYGQKVLSIAMLVSAISVYLIIPISKNINFILSELSSVLALSIIVCIVLFLFPSIAIGTLSPIIFKLYVWDITNIGKKYGLFSSVWSLGSILGVFITGFYFISTIGSSDTIYLISLILLSLFYFFYIKNIERQSAHFKHQMAIVIVVSACLVAVIGYVIWNSESTAAKILFQKETSYYNVRVVNYNIYPQFGRNRILFLDVDAHSIQTEKPTHEFYTDISPVFSIFSSRLENIYVIGAGAYTLPINLRKYYPSAQISVGEIDPELEKVGRAYFNLGAYDIQTETGDARVKFSDYGNNQSEKYDLIYGDAYNSFISVPWYLLTKEFAVKMKNHLADDGIYAINFIGTLEGSNARMFESVYSTIHDIFPNTYIFSFGQNRTKIQNITILGVKNNVVFSHDAIVKKLDAIDKVHFLSGALVNKDDLNEGRGIKDGITLTDDFSPIEHMMIGLMEEYFPKYIELYREVLN